MHNEHEHATKLRQACENMKKCRDAALEAKKRIQAREQFDQADDQPGSASTPADPLTNLQGQHKAVGGGPTL